MSYKDPYFEALMERVQDIPQGEPICPGPDWDKDPQIIHDFDQLFTAIASRFDLDIFPNQYKISSTNTMLDIYSQSMPIMYRHWKFGKAYNNNKRAYEAGQLGLAYEVVFNTNPCISANMISNTTAINALVMAHAAQGHNSFFKGNHLFREWTQPEGIMDYLRYATKYIEKCYQKIGEKPVEQFLTSCHAIENMGVNRHKRNTSIQKEADALRELEETFSSDEERTSAEIEKAVASITKRNNESLSDNFDYSCGGEENLLYALEKESIAAKRSQLINGSPWMVEIIRIVRMISQYFYPQKQTQVMNEGWATFWHHAITTVAHAKGYLTDAQYQDIITLHTNVIYQPPYNQYNYTGRLNPYKLGFEIFRDIMFMARGPQTKKERLKYESSGYKETFKDNTFPHNGKATPFLGADWLSLMHFAMRNYRDETFLQTFLSKSVCNDMDLFAVSYDVDLNYNEIIGIQGNLDVIKSAFSNQYNLSKIEPQISAIEFKPYGDRIFRMQHISEDGRPLDAKTAEKVVKHINVLLRGPESLDSSKEYKDFKTHLKSINMRNPDKPIIMDTWPRK